MEDAKPRRTDPDVDHRYGRRDFERFVADSTADLLRTAYLLVWDLQGAEDLVQECLLQVARRWPRVRAMDHPRAYARRIMVNLALDGAKARSRQRAELEASSAVTLQARQDESSVRDFEAAESASAVLEVIEGLPARQRAVVVLRFYEDLSEAQVAALLGCSVGTVKSTTSRALERLRWRGTLRPSPIHPSPIPAADPDTGPVTKGVHR